MNCFLKKVKKKTICQVKTTQQVHKKYLKTTYFILKKCLLIFFGNKYLYKLKLYDIYKYKNI